MQTLNKASWTDSLDLSVEQAPRDVEGQGSLACCSPWGHKELDMTEQSKAHCYEHISKLLKEK